MPAFFAPELPKQLSHMSFDDLDKLFRVRILAPQNSIEMMPSVFYSKVYDVDEQHLLIMGKPYKIDEVKIELVLKMILDDKSGVNYEQKPMMIC